MLDKENKGEISRDETRAAGAGLCCALLSRCQADLQSRGRAGRGCVLGEDCFVGGVFCLFSVLGPLYATHHLHCCLQDCTFLLPLPFEQTVSLVDDSTLNYVLFSFPFFHCSSSSSSFSSRCSCRAHRRSSAILLTFLLFLVICNIFGSCSM